MRFVAAIALFAALLAAPAADAKSGPDAIFSPMP